MDFTNEIEILEKLRKKLKKTQKVENFAGVLLYVSIFVLIVSLAGDSAGVAITSVMLFGISIMILSNGKSHKLYGEYTKLLLRPFLKKEFNGFFRDNKDEEYKELFSLLTEFDFKKEKDYTYYSNNIFDFNYKGFSSLLAYSHLGISNGKSTNTLFDGTLFITRLPFSIDDILFIKKAKYSENSINFSNKDFMNNFYVSGSDATTINFILTPIVMDNLVKFLNKNIDREFDISIFSNKLIINFRNNNIYSIEQDLFKREINSQSVNDNLRYIGKKIYFILNLIDCFEFASSSIKKSSYSENLKIDNTNISKSLTKNIETNETKDKKNIPFNKISKLSEEDKVNLKADTSIPVRSSYFNLFFANTNSPYVGGRFIFIGICLFIFFLINSNLIREKSFIDSINERIILFFYTEPKVLNEFKNLKETSNFEVKNLSFYAVCTKFNILNNFNSKCEEISLIKDENNYLQLIKEIYKYRNLFEEYYKYIESSWYLIKEGNYKYPGYLNNVESIWNLKISNVTSKLTNDLQKSLDKFENIKFERINYIFYDLYFGDRFGISKSIDRWSKDKNNIASLVYRYKEISKSDKYDFNKRLENELQSTFRIIQNNLLKKYNINYILVPYKDINLDLFKKSSLIEKSAQLKNIPLLIEKIKKQEDKKYIVINSIDLNYSFGNLFSIFLLALSYFSLIGIFLKIYFAIKEATL